MLVFKLILAPYPQRGSALIVSLVFLLLLTMLGVGAMKSSVLQERMAGNTRDTNLAFQAAESALRAGENVVGQSPLPDFGGTVPGYRAQVEKATGDYWTKKYLWDDVAAANGGSQRFNGALGGVVEAPRFVIEKFSLGTGQTQNPLDSVKASVGGGRGAGGATRPIYRITARGVGQSTDTVVILQSTFRPE